VVTRRGRREGNEKGDGWDGKGGGGGVVEESGEEMEMMRIRGMERDRGENIK
jgi:hypothetical protein